MVINGQDLRGSAVPPKHDIAFDEALALLRSSALPISTARDQNLDSLRQLERLNALSSHLLAYEPDTFEFWAKYASVEAFNRLKQDLAIPEQALALWQLYFDYYNGSYVEQLAASAAFLRAKLPWSPPLENITVMSINAQINAIFDTQSTNPASELLRKGVALYEFALENEGSIRAKIDKIEGIITSESWHQKSKCVIMYSKGQASQHLQQDYAQQVADDLQYLSDNIKKQRQVIWNLLEIECIITALSQEGLVNTDFNEAFDREVEWAHEHYIRKKGVSNVEPLNTTQEKIAHMCSYLEDFDTEISRLLSNRNQAILTTLSNFIKKRENPMSIAGVVHRLLLIFSSAYEAFFNSLQAINKSTDSQEKVPDIIKVVATEASSTPVRFFSKHILDRITEREGNVTQLHGVLSLK